MSNAQKATDTRPTLAKKHTNSSEAKRKKELDQSFAVRIDGEDYVLTPSELTGVQEMRIRKETGYSITSLLQELQVSPGVDLVGIFMWVCALTQGKAADLNEILEGISYASDVEVVGDEAEPADLPEA